MSYFQIVSKIEKGIPIDFGNVLSKSFDLFKKVWLQGFLHLIIVIAITLPMIAIVFSPLMLLSVGESYTTDFDIDDPAFSITLIIAMIICGVIAVILTTTIAIGTLSGFYYICKEADMMGDTNAGYFFRYLSKKYFLKTLGLGAAYIGIMILGYACCFLPLLYLMVPLSLFTVVYAFNPDFTISEIINISFKMGNKNWFMLFGLAVVGGMIAQLGILLCGIGLLFTMCFTHLQLYYVYKDTIGFDSDAEINEIGVIEE